MFVCQHCGQISSSITHKRAANHKAWAIGAQQSNGFHVRKIVWGLLMAQAEMRVDEEIRAALLMVENVHKPRRNLLRDLPEREDSSG
jgi:hypothetical protein